MRLIKNKYVYTYKCMLYIFVLCNVSECNANIVKMKVHQVQTAAATAAAPIEAVVVAKLLLFFFWKQFSM